MSRQILDPLNSSATVPADYSQLGILLMTVTCLGLLLPILTILLTNDSLSQSQ